MSDEKWIELCQYVVVDHIMNGGLVKRGRIDIVRIDLRDPAQYLYAYHELGGSGEPRMVLCLKPEFGAYLPAKYRQLNAECLAEKLGIVVEKQRPTEKPPHPL